MPIRFLTVDDSELICASLRAELGSVAGIAAIREATSLAEALDIQTLFRHCAQHQPNA